MSYWILPKSGEPISCVTVQRLTNLQQQTDRYRELMEEFQTKITNKWENPQQIDVVDVPRNGTYNNVLSLEKEDDEFISEFNRVIQDHDLKEADDLTTDDPEFGTCNPYIDMELSLRPSKEEAVLEL